MMRCRQKYSFNGSQDLKDICCLARISAAVRLDIPFPERTEKPLLHQSQRLLCESPGAEWERFKKAMKNAYLHASSEVLLHGRMRWRESNKAVTSSRVFLTRHFQVRSR